MLKLLKNKKIIVSFSILVLLLCGLIIAWTSSLYTLNRLSFKEVTPTNLASAMRQDEFWSTYRFNTLIFDGKIQSINSNHDKTTLGFVTSDKYGVSCEVNELNTAFKVGATYKFEVEAYQAERQPHSVLLHNCLSE
jgi:hypothetical protein